VWWVSTHGTLVCAQQRAEAGWGVQELEAEIMRLQQQLETRTRDSLRHTQESSALYTQLHQQKAALQEYEVSPRAAPPSLPRASGARCALLRTVHACMLCTCKYASRCSRLGALRGVWTGRSAADA
jgi:hypothetical protein